VVFLLNFVPAEATKPDRDGHLAAVAEPIFQAGSASVSNLMGQVEGARLFGIGQRRKKTRQRHRLSGIVAKDGEAATTV
jgi:hypothetical protein